MKIYTKNIIIYTLIIVILVGLSGCGYSKKAENTSESAAARQGKNDKKIVAKNNDKQPAGKDSELVDLTKMSTTAIYSEVYNMMYSPKDYTGKKIKIEGIFSSGEDAETKKRYTYCVIQDATKCCQQGLEFTWKGTHKYPNDYPKEGEIIVVEGVFETYKNKKSDKIQFCRLKDAEVSMK